MYNYFVDENEAFYKKYKFYNDDGTRNERKHFEHLEYLNKVVRSCSLGNKHILIPKTNEISFYELLL